MLGRPQLRIARMTAICVLLAAAAAVQAQVCNAPLPKPGTMPEPGAQKFSMISQQCEGLGGPVVPHRAKQLELYDRSSVTIDLDRPAPPRDAAPPVDRVPPVMLPAPKFVDTPLRENGARALALAPALLEAARESDLDPLLLHAIAHVESRHNAAAVSPAGARGLMQVMPATGRRFGVSNEQSLLDANTNLRASAAYLRTLHRRFNGELKLVLAAYNAGEGAVDKYGRSVPPYAETQAYVRDVLAVYRRLTDTFSVSPSGALLARGEVQ